VPKQHKLDQFYTKPEIVEHVLQMVDCSPFDLIVEPSAGAGDFLKYLPLDKTLAMDLEPAVEGIERRDFFEFLPTDGKNILTIGNPPFGKNSSLAVMFFNHAAQFSDCIAFIVPRTFRKPSVINRLDNNFHLTSQEILPLESFYDSSGETHEVPTVFQVWEKQFYPRTKTEVYTQHPDFDILTTNDYNVSTLEVRFNMSGAHYGAKEEASYIMDQAEYKTVGDLRKRYPKLFSAHRITTVEMDLTWKNKPDFAWRRAGARSGEVFPNYGACPLQGFEFIKVNTPGVLTIFKQIWKEIWDPGINKDRSDSKWDTAGQASISRHELIKLYREYKIKEKTINE